MLFWNAILHVCWPAFRLSSMALSLVTPVVLIQVKVESEVLVFVRKG